MLIKSPVIVARTLWEKILPNQYERISKINEFETSMNFVFKSRLITLLFPPRPLIPFGIKILDLSIIDSFFSHKIPIFISKNGLKSSKIVINLLNAPKKELNLKEAKLTSKNLEKIRHVLEKNACWLDGINKEYNFVLHVKNWITGNKYRDKSLQNFNLDHFKPFLKVISSRLLTKRFCSQLLGWGTGSTPAGDDFIVGCLAACYISEIKNSNEFKQFNIILNSLLNENLTTLISKEFLYYASKGEFAESFIEFYNESILDQYISQKTFQQIYSGTSSGLDLLWGFIWTIEQLI